MSSLRNSSKIIALIVVVMVTAFGCKSKKKAMEASNAEKQKVEQEAALKKQQEEEARKREAEENARREEEARRNEAATASAPKARLTQYFEAIARSSNVASANSSINEALTMFASPDTPVLIVISESGGAKDYDRPTIIRDYLNYLKDQKKNINSISDIKVDSSGKITELELRKN